MIARYRSRWIERTQSYLAQLVPPDLPKRVVYPFGGGDLFTALHAFPSAEEYTTISLENAGDIRGVAALDWEDLGSVLHRRGGKQYVLDEAAKKKKKKKKIT